MKTDRSFPIEAFCDHLVFERGASGRTVEAYRRDIGRLAEFLRARGAEGAADASPADLRDYVYQLKDRGLQASSIRRNLSAVRSYYRFLLSEGHVVADPTERVELPRTWRRLPHALGRGDV